MISHRALFSRITSTRIRGRREQCAETGSGDVGIGSAKSKRHQYTAIAHLGVLWFAASFFNLTKAYHIDDGAHLEIAQWISQHPLHPMSGLINWGGSPEPISRLNQPHFYFYLMAIWGSIAGYNEIPMHILQSIFVLLAIVFFNGIATVIAEPIACWLTTIFALSPAFVVGQNMMVDVPLVSMWLGVFYCLLKARNREGPSLLHFKAASFASAALLTKYSSLVLLPIIVINALIKRCSFALVFAFMPVLVITGWSVFNYLDYGGIHLLSRPASHAGLHQWVSASAAWTVTLGAILPVGMSFLAAYRSRNGNAQKSLWELWLFFPLVSFFALAILSYLQLVAESFVSKILWGLFTLNGLCLLIIFASRMVSWRGHPFKAVIGKPEVLMTLWLMGTWTFYVLFAPFVATRHVLLIVPPLLFGVASGCHRPLPSIAKISAILTTVFLTFALALSDWEFANFYRMAAATFSGGSYNHGNVWFSGHWGWQWYAKKNGLKQIDVAAPKFDAGDIVLVPVDVAHEPIQYPGKMAVIGEIVQERSWKTLFCTAQPARFYDSTAVLIPWTITRDCIGEIEIFTVTPRNLQK